MAFFTSMIEVVDVFGWSSTSDQSKIALRGDKNPQTVVSDVVGRAKLQHEKYNDVMTAARRGMPGSRRLEQHALNIMELAERAQKAPCTHFMPDIARSVLQLMNELLSYAEYEASHLIFRFMRDMGREADALEGKMQALRVLMEAELEWKRREGHAV